MRLADHPKWPEIKEVILDPGRTKSWREIAEEFDVRNERGALATTQLLAYYKGIREKFSDLFEVGRQAIKDVLANEVIEMHKKSFKKAEAGYDAAMSQTKLGFVKDRGLKIQLPDPNFNAADMMLQNMNKAAESLGSLVKPEPTTNLINPVFGNQKVQVLAMPKCLPEQKQVRDQRVIEAGPDQAA